MKNNETVREATENMDIETSVEVTSQKSVNWRKIFKWTGFSLFNLYLLAVVGLLGYKKGHKDGDLVGFLDGISNGVDIGYNRGYFDGFEDGHYNYYI